MTMGPFKYKFTWIMVIIKTRQTYLLTGSTQTVDIFWWTVIFYLAMISGKLTNTIQRSASNYKLLRTFKVLSSYETKTNIL